MYNSKEEEGSVHTRLSGLHLRLYASLPLRYLSQCWGALNDIELPKFAREPVYRTFSWIFGCKLDEMVEKNLKKFRNLGEFFYREIRPECRTIASKKEASIVSPADGRIIHFGQIEHDEVEQIKGVTYSLNALLGKNPNTKIHEDGPTYIPKTGHNLYFAVVYLAPGDYHRFHSPTEWSVSMMRHFAGEMFSVSPYMVKTLRHLFTLNERVSLVGEWEKGMFSMVAVAATNVGKIKLKFLPNLLTNVPHKELDRPLGTAIEEKIMCEKGDPLKFQRGMEMGGFQLGSTIVLVFEAPNEFQFKVEHNQKIQMGEPIGM